MKFESTLEVFEDTKLWGHYFKVPDEVVQKMKAARPDKRVIININQGEDMHVALMPKSSFHFIMTNKTNVKKLGLKIADEVTISIRPDDTTYGMPMPRELEEYLTQDDEGSNYFEALTPGKQRALIHLVLKLKSSDKRIEKSHIIVQHLKRQKGNVDFRVLHEDFKKGI